MTTENTQAIAPPTATARGGFWTRGRWPSAIAAICLTFFVIRAFVSMVGESATWDETHYFGLGKYLLQTGRWDVPGSVLHPPLSYYIHSIPWLFVSTDADAWKVDPQEEGRSWSRTMADVDRGRLLLASSANRDDRLLTLSRLMMVLTAVLLGWFVYRWSHALYGGTGAVLAIVLYTFCPNILAHARLITPDITITVFSFISAYYFWRILKDNRLGDTIVGGIFFGLALLSKFTALLLFPTFWILALLWRIKRGEWRVQNCLLFVALGFVVLLLGYRMNLEPYFTGILFQHGHATAGHCSFLIGQYSTNGWWYYFPVAFFVKTPIPAIILMTIALGLLAKKFRGDAWVDEMFLLVPAAAVLGFFGTNRINIGLRYVLPIYPFLFVFASSAVRAMSGRTLRRWLMAVLMVWYVGAAWYIHPHYFAYFNELVGGPNHGYHCLVDSNFDWGQDLKGLKAYMAEHGIPRIGLSYFGSDSPVRYGIVYDWMPGTDVQSPFPQKPGEPPTRWVAISATHIQGVFFENRNLYRWFREHDPVAKIGYTIFIYHLDPNHK